MKTHNNHKKDIHALSGIRTLTLHKQEATGLRLRLRGQWDQTKPIYMYNMKYGNNRLNLKCLSFIIYNPRWPQHAPSRPLRYLVFISVTFEVLYLVTLNSPIFCDIKSCMTVGNDRCFAVISDLDSTRYHIPQVGNLHCLTPLWSVSRPDKLNKWQYKLFFRVCLRKFVLSETC